MGECEIKFGIPESVSVLNDTGFRDENPSTPLVMPAMQIGVVWVRMVQGFMTVPVRMRLRHWPIMGMLVMVVMRMTVFAFQPIVLVSVLMALREMKP